MQYVFCIMISSIADQARMIDNYTNIENCSVGPQWTGNPKLHIYGSVRSRFY